MFESMRNVVIPAGFCYYEELNDENHAFFVVNTTYNVTKDGNKICVHNNWGKHSPIIGIGRIVYIGTSSLTIALTMFDYKTGVQLCSCLLSFVYVDIASRKSVKLPTWFRESVSKIPHLQNARPAPRFGDFSVPPNIYKYNVKALHSDIDYNGHVTQSVYVKWCNDAGTDAAVNGFYFDFQENISNYDIEKMEVSYIGEVLVNDEIVVGTWQEDGNKKKLGFAMSTKRGPVFAARFTYFSGMIKSNL